MSSPMVSPKKAFLLKRKTETEQSSRAEQSDKDDTAKRIKSVLDSSFSDLCQKRRRTEPPPAPDSEAAPIDVAAAAIDRSAFNQRIQTFKPLQWSSFSPVAPMECARAGWSLTGQDLLRCDSCQASLYGKLASDCDPAVFAKSVDALRTRLTAGHHRFCAWATIKAPATFMEPPVPTHREDLLQYYLARVKANIKFGKAMPRFTPKSQNAILPEELMGWLRQKLDDAGGDEDEQRSALVLAACGWDVTGEDKMPLLSCGVCQRSCGTWMYTTLKDALPSDATEEIFVSDPLVVQKDVELPKIVAEVVENVVEEVAQVAEDAAVVQDVVESVVEIVAEDQAENESAASKKIDSPAAVQEEEEVNPDGSTAPASEEEEVVSSVVSEEDASEEPDSPELSEGEEDDSPAPGPSNKTVELDSTSKTDGTINLDSTENTVNLSTTQEEEEEEEDLDEEEDIEDSEGEEMDSSEGDMREPASRRPAPVPTNAADDSDSDVIEILSSDDEDNTVPNVDGMFDTKETVVKSLFHPLNVHSHLKWCSWLRGLVEEPEVAGWKSVVRVLDAAMQAEKEPEEESEERMDERENTAPEQSLEKVRQFLDGATSNN